MHEQLGLGFGEADLLPFKKKSGRRLQRAQFSKDRRAFDHCDLTQFVEGRSNGDAFKALNSFLYETQFPFKSLYLYGKSGVGKSLLSMSFIGEFLQSNKTTNCKLLSGSDFVAERDAAIELNRKSAFLNETSSVDFLIIDGLHQLLLSREVLNDFIHILSLASSCGTKILVISPLSLSSVKRYSTELEKAFISFLPVKVDYLDAVTAEAIFRLKVNELKISLDPDVWGALSFKNIRTGHDIDRLIREIFRIGLLESLDTLGADSLCRHGVIKGRTATDPAIDSVIVDFLSKLDISLEEILSPSRKANIAIDRHITMHYLNREKGMSLSRIARYFERDHTVVIYAVKKVQSELDRGENGRFFKKLIAYQEFIHNKM